MIISLLNLLISLIAPLLSIAAQAFYLWIAQIFVMREERRGFFSLMGLVVVGNFLSGLAYMAVMRFAPMTLPMPSLFAMIAVFSIWTLAIKFWYDTAWDKALALMIIASILQMLTIYLAMPKSWGMRPFREIGL